MPTSTRAEALVGIAEVIDGGKSIDPSEQPISGSGPAIEARREAHPQFPPLGPPDMLYVRKRYVPVVGAPKQYGYYHFVRGVTTSSVANISAYIVDVVDKSGLDPQFWVSPGTWEVVSATFLAYNIMAHADLSVHVNLPGSTTPEALDQNGNPVPLSDEFWHQLHVSSYIRDCVCHGEQPLYPCLRVISPSSSPQVEKAVLDSAARCVQDWKYSGSSSSNDHSVEPSKSRIAYALRDQFLSLARYEAAYHFFRRNEILNVDPQCAVHAAAASRLMGALEQATNIIDDVIEKCPESDIAWMERSNIHRARGNLSEAIDAAKFASKYFKDDVLLWASVADLYIDSKRYAESLNSLNRADMPPPTIDHLLRLLLRERNSETTPIEGAANGTDAVRVFAKRLREEKNISNDKTDDVLSDLPAKLMQDVDHACYAVLVKILNDITWDRMLAVRGQCFVMETDIENGQLTETDLHESESGTDYDEAPVPEPPQDSVGNGLSKISLDENADAPGNLDVRGDENDNDMSTKARKLSLEKSGKKVCKPWLDYLVTNMYNDLRAMALWHAEEHQHAAAASLTAAANLRRSHGDANDRSLSEISHEAPGQQEVSKDVEAQDSDEPIQRSPDEIVSTTNRPSADWLRRGELALRLSKFEDARTAFQVCVRVAEKEKKVAVTALCRLMTLASEDGDVRSTIRFADAIWDFLDANTDRKPSSEPTPAVKDLRKALFKLVSAKGLSTVRDVLTNAGVDVDKKRFEGLLLDAVALKVDGFSR